MLERSDAFFRAAFGMPARPVRTRANVPATNGTDAAAPEAAGPAFPGARVPEGAEGTKIPAKTNRSKQGGPLPDRPFAISAERQDQRE